MTIKQYRFAVAEAENYDNLDAYVSNVSHSSVWDDAEDAEIPAERIELLRRIWIAYQRSVKEIAAAAGLSQRKLSERFGVPYRTAEDWCAGKSQCAPYIRMMMQECLDLLHIDFRRA